MTKYGDKLYDLLPPIYKKEDSQIRPVPFPLQRFLQVAGVGFDYLDKKAEGHTNLYDVDRTPAELLPHLAQMMGFAFPYEMTETEQRTFLKALPTLYKYKGTARVFDYLGQVIFGQYTRVNSQYELNTDPLTEAEYRHTINVYLQVIGSTLDITAKADRYRKFAENFRPLNTKLNPVLQMFYTDEYARLLNGDFDVAIVRHFETDVYNTAKLIDLEGTIALREFETDSYNKANAEDTFTTERIIVRPEVELYTAVKEDSSTDYLHYIGAKIGFATLNGTMILNQKPQTIIK